MDRRVPIKTLYLLVVVFIGLIGLAVGSTFAIFEASIEIDNPISLSSNLTYEDEVMQTITVKLEAEEIKTITLNVKNQTSNEMKYNVWYEESDNSIDFGTEDDMIGTVNALDTKTLTITIRNNENKNIELLIGVSVGTGDSSVVLADNMNLIPKQAMPFKIVALATYISNLYDKADKTEVNNGVSTSGIVTHNIAPSVRLMNDRLGTMDTDINDGNIRYYGTTGSDEPKNYIYFNCNDYTNQDSASCELWRIIGVFNVYNADTNKNEKMVKIMRNTSIGNYSWDTSASSVNSGKGLNDWSGADLMKLLNPGYDNNTDLDSSNNDITVNNSLYWNRTAGNCYNGYNNAITNSCDFTEAGLKNIETKNKIANVMWQVGNISTQKYPSEVYAQEYNSTDTWTGKIALASGADLGYAPDLSSCNRTLWYYNNCSNNWIQNIRNVNGIQTWLLTGVSNSNDVWRVGNGAGSELVYTAYAVNPTLYLKANTMFTGGDGTSGNPYQIN